MVVRKIEVRGPKPKRISGSASHVLCSAYPALAPLGVILLHAFPGSCSSLDLCVGMSSGLCHIHVFPYSRCWIHRELYACTKGQNYNADSAAIRYGTFEIVKRTVLCGP